MQVPHASAVYEASTERFMDTGDHTVTIDPMKRDQWIFDGYNKHNQSQKRGLVYDKIAFQQVLGWENADKGSPSFFMPTVRQLDVMNKYTNPPTDPNCPGYRGPRLGKLPVISQQLYDGSLQNKSEAVIEHEMREAARRESARLFDTSGYTR